MKQRGFTLVETLVALSIFAVVGVITVDLLTRTFEGGNKAQIISKIKQNGQSVLNQMDEAVRTADNLLCPPDPASQTSTASQEMVVNKNNNLIRYRIVNQSGTNNGEIFEDLLDPNATDACLSSVTVISSRSLTDTNQVSVTSGHFKRYPLSGNVKVKDGLEIEFNLKSSVNETGGYEYQLDSILFRTIVNLR